LKARTWTVELTVKVALEIETCETLNDGVSVVVITAFSKNRGQKGIDKLANPGVAPRLIEAF
jgi:hypothetical protein